MGRVAVRFNLPEIAAVVNLLVASLGLFADDPRSSQQVVVKITKWVLVTAHERKSVRSTRVEISPRARADFWK